jgi:hypothetical protein
MVTKAEVRDRLFSDLLTAINQQVISAETAPPEFSDWLIKENVILDGKPFSFKGHEYLIEPYKDMHPFQVEIKATQLGLTSKALLRVLYGCRYGNYRGIAYLFPSRTDVTDLSRTRLTPLIEDNPGNIGQWIRDTDSANVKKIWNSFLYLRGMKSRVGLKSVPIDFEVFDELDEAPPNSVDMALERMAHSEQGHLLFLSNPTTPDYGIDRLFQTTDQQYWLLKCPACNEYTNLVDTFPECLQTVRGRTYRACMKCGQELDPAKGEWVAKYPHITEKRGRQYSQLFSQYKINSPENILHRFRTTNNLTDFYNLKIGVAYVDAHFRLSLQQVYDCCTSGGMESSSEKGCYMGVDQGNNLHVVIGRRHEKRRGEIIYVDVLKGNNQQDAKDDSGWRQLDELMNRFHVLRCVVDAMPNTKAARNFSERFPGRVFLCYYNEHQKGNYRWNEKEMIVHANRTESLDSSHREIAEQLVYLPRQSDMIQKFAFHLHNVAKKLIEDDDTGSQRYVYLKLGEDHFRHAFNYEAMARQDSPELIFSELL